MFSCEKQVFFTVIQFTYCYKFIITKFDRNTGEDVNIGLLGLGTIGTGAYELINTGCCRFPGEKARITKILDKDPSKHADGAEIVTDPNAILEDDSIKIVIGLMGGHDFEYEMLKKALEKGKHVVTANKAVIGAHFEEMCALAEKNGVMLRYEASVGGGIPIIKNLEQQLRLNNIDEISGILNGTTNYILTKMTQDKTDFADALKEAQAVGFAEADPSADIGGGDVARKIAILSSLAYGGMIGDEKITKRGLDDVRACDIFETGRMGYRIKHLGQSINRDGVVSAVVEPVLFKQSSPMAGVNNEFNLVSIHGDVISELQFYGKGAGKEATANAIVQDVLDIMKNLEDGTSIPQPVFNEQLELEGNEAFSGEYYLRINLGKDKRHDLSDILEKVEDLCNLKHVNTADNKVFIFTDSVKSTEFDKLVDSFHAEPGELFYARICE
jgi:homoserine dehydrogenase